MQKNCSIVTVMKNPRFDFPSVPESKLKFMRETKVSCLGFDVRSIIVLVCNMATVCISSET